MLTSGELLSILDTEAPWHEREGLVRAAIECTGVMNDAALRTEIADHTAEVNDGAGHWSDLAVIVESIPYARGDAGPGFQGISVVKD